MLPRFRLLPVIFAALAVFGASGAARGGDTNVIELFTSQGCSSCPKADALLASYATRNDIVALSFNVDYWDYLGWKDTLANPSFTLRWREYANSRGDGQVYTPQAVVNGMNHAIGSKAKRIDAELIATNKLLTGRRPRLTVKTGTEAIEISVGDLAEKPRKPATVWVEVVSPSVSVPITRGENVGATITYINVVRSLQMAGTWTGEALSITFPITSLGPNLIGPNVVAPNAPGPITHGSNKNDRAVVLVQEGATGPILAAAWAP